MSAPEDQVVPGHPSNSSAPFVAADHLKDNKRHLLLAASGSVATIKLPNIVQALSECEALSIRILLTKSAENFLAGQSAEQPALDSLRAIANVDGIYHDEDEWKHPWTRGGGILHIELRRWADLLVIAPLSANSLAKIVGGFSDNLLLSVVRAWDTTDEIESSLNKKRIIVAPAMNTAMWRHPITKRQIEVLEEDWGVQGDFLGWFEVLKPIEKELACGDVGDGAMQDWNELVAWNHSHGVHIGATSLHLYSHALKIANLRVCSDPNPQTPSTSRQQRTKAALSKLRRRLSLPALDASIRRLIYLLTPRPDWGKARAETPSQCRRQDDRVEHYLSLMDPYWSTTSTERTSELIESLPVPASQPPTTSWLKCTVKPCCGLLKREMQTSPADSEAEIPSVDKALPDSEIFRRLEILHDEQKKLELEILLRDLRDVRIAGESSSCGARHISAQWEELDRISQYVPCAQASKCVAGKLDGTRSRSEGQQQDVPKQRVQKRALPIPGPENEGIIASEETEPKM
ncbi:MAG: hypothetical protein M1836_005294 [Candelina mexicana]|nr:MAG: hypothetical protein M1836_005294 [Candelina mexicana]